MNWQPGLSRAGKFTFFLLLAELPCQRLAEVGSAVPAALVERLVVDASQWVEVDT